MTQKSFTTDLTTNPYPFITKLAAEKKDYSNNWAEWLAKSGADTIANSAWTADAGITISSSPAPTFEATGLATVWLQGGTAGGTYKITNTITTTAGRTAVDIFSVLVK